MAYSTSYTASLSNGIKDIAGHGLTPNPTRWSFTTAPDTISPTVTTKAPLAGATGVAVSSTVTATFSEAVKSLYCNWYYVYTQGQVLGPVSQER